MRRMSDGSEFQADGQEIANDRDPKTVFEAGTQSSPDDADRRLDRPATGHLSSIPTQLFLLSEELSNTIFSCLLTLTVGHLEASRHPSVSRFVIRHHLLPSC